MSSHDAETAPQGTLTMRLYNRLRRDIINGTLAPGKKLKIEEMRAAYEVGTTPLRDALNLLTSFGFVERMEQRGFKVKPISAAEFDDLLKVRCWVEERALRESIANGDAAWEEGVALAQFRLGRLAQNTETVEAPGWEALHWKFHLALLSACGSPMLLDYCKQLHDQNIRYRQIAGLVSAPRRNANAEHAKIAEAALERRPDVAVSLLCEHYRTTGRYLKLKLFSTAEATMP